MRKYPNIKVAHLYDPSIGYKSAPPLNTNKFDFHYIGIGPRDEVNEDGWELCHLNTCLETH